MEDPLADQDVYSRLDGDECLVSVQNVRRVLAKITTTTTGLPECFEHRAVVNVACRRCRAAYVEAALMLRAKALCLLGAGCCLEPLCRFMFAVLTTTDVLVGRLVQRQRDHLTNLLSINDERRKMRTAGVDMQMVYNPVNAAVLRSTQMVWVESDREMWRQGVDPDRVREWVVELKAFLQCAGPRPAPPVEAEPLREGREYVSVEAPIDYSPAWFARLIEGVKGA